jgi:Histidine phosphatase superfamily (branch 1)
MPQSDHHNVQTAGLSELILVRHGESQGNVAATTAGDAGAHVIEVPARDADVELSVTGREQALALGRLFADYPAPSGLRPCGARRTSGRAKRRSWLCRLAAGARVS